MVRLFLTLLLFFVLFIFGCGPSQAEIEDTIDSKFQNLMASFPTPTPVTIKAHVQANTHV